MQKSHDGGGRLVGRRKQKFAAERWTSRRKFAARRRDDAWFQGLLRGFLPENARRLGDGAGRADSKVSIGVRDNNAAGERERERGVDWRKLKSA